MDRVAALSTSNPLNAIHTNYTRDDNNTFTIRRRKRQGPLVGGRRPAETREITIQKVFGSRYGPTRWLHTKLSESPQQQQESDFFQLTKKQKTK